MLLVIYLTLIFVMAFAQRKDQDSFYTEAEVLNLFSDNGIAVVPEISFHKIRRMTINKVIYYATHSRCHLTITAGDELGHMKYGKMTHYTGHKVHIKSTDCFNRYITFNCMFKERNEHGSPRYMCITGNEFTVEGDHWDVLIVSGVN